MGRISGKTQKGGLSTVKIVENGVEIHKSIEHEIVEECIKEARTRFKQTENTPFMQPHLVTDFGYMVTTRAAHKVWDGIYKALQDANKYAVRLLEQLKILDRIRDNT